MAGNPSTARTLVWLGVAAGVVCAIAATGGLLGLRVNLSASLPYGVYRLTDDEPTVGSLVTFCVPDRLAHLEIFSRATVGVCIGGSGKPLLKRVAQIDNDSGAITVAGDSERSIDSRWFGPLYRDELISAAQPIWLFSGRL